MIHIRTALMSALVLSTFAIAPALSAEQSLATSPGTYGPMEQVPQTNPLSGDEAAIKKGKTLYRQVCSLCHGARADGAGERGNGADLRKFNRGFKAYIETVLNGRSTRGQSQVMPPWRDVISEEDIYVVGAYLETLAMDGANWKEGIKN